MTSVKQSILSATDTPTPLKPHKDSTPTPVPIEADTNVIDPLERMKDQVGRSTQ